MGAAFEHPALKRDVPASGPPLSSTLGLTCVHFDLFFFLSLHTLRLGLPLTSLSRSFVQRLPTPFYFLAGLSQAVISQAPF